MKNEPTIAYDHLQEEEHGQSETGHDSHAENKMNWRVLVHPLAIAVEITAIVVMAFFMILEMFR
jgi:hypothetical protein